MNKKRLSFPAFVLVLILAFSCLLSSCGSSKPRIVKWENMDVTIQNYEPITPELVKSTPPDPKELDQNSKAYQAYFIPEKGYYSYVNSDKVSKFDQNNNLIYSASTDYYTYYTDSLFHDDSNPYLNPKTLIHPEPRPNKDFFPIDLFTNKNKEIVSVTQEKDIYTVQKNKKVIATGNMLLYSNPWILTTDDVRDPKFKLWKYSLYNTDTDNSYVISIPGKIDSVTLVKQGLFVTVIEQAFFKTTSWLFNPSKNKLLQIGEAHTKIVSVKDTPWIVFWDWYENIGKVFHYDQWKELYRIDFGKYQVRSIIPYEDIEGMWNLWMIPTLTYEKFISNVFWMPLNIKATTITNMDFHQDFMVSDLAPDSQGRLLLDVGPYLFLTAKNPKAYLMPMVLDKLGSIRKLTFTDIKKSLVSEDLVFSAKSNLLSNQLITSKIEPFSDDIVPKMGNQNGYWRKNWPINWEEVIYGRISQKQYYDQMFETIFTTIKDGKISAKDNTITWTQAVSYSSDCEFKIPISKLVPKK